MKIISWNVNGLRAIHRKGNWEELLAYDADIIGIQETKAEADQLPDKVRNPDGYHGYFYSSQERKGYAGVAMYSKTKPDDVTYGLPEQYGVADTQGRTLTLHFPTHICITCLLYTSDAADE